MFAIESKNLKGYFLTNYGMNRVVLPCDKKKVWKTRVGAENHIRNKMMNGFNIYEVVEA